MSEWLVVVAIVLAGSSGLPGLLFSRERRAGEYWFTAIVTVAGLCACLAAIGALAFDWSRDLAAAWNVPGGSVVIRVDAISAIFVIQIAVLATLGAWYGLEYWPQTSHVRDGRKLRAFFGAVTAGMLLLVVAHNAVLFLMGWEIMALAAFVLVSTEDEKQSAREAGYLYLVATRFGTLCVFAMFALLGFAAGSLDMDAWRRIADSPLRDAILVLAVCGFGLKAGVMPFHIWLPSAHATSPSHVSALMSGVLIKLGIYGLVRVTGSLSAPPMWWGYLLIGLGAVSGVLGVAFAIGQHDLKRLLAYHSVENIGIICLGLGVALLGRSLERPELVALGLGGALLHVWNHGLFKALLFLSAGSVLHATGTREIDRLGGLWRRMPRTGLAFLIGAIAICGLPPLNGLISEVLVYLGLVRIGVGSVGSPWIAGTVAAPALALIGALAVACFVKAFGSVFLGRARTSDVERAHESGLLMSIPMALLAAGCLIVGLGAPLLAGVLDQATSCWIGERGAAAPTLNAIAPLASLSAANAALLLALATFGGLLFAHIRSVSTPAAVGTWDCGYAAPTARMQYTSSSFGESLVRLLGWFLRPDLRATRIDSTFPTAASFHGQVPDVVLDRVVVPSFEFAGRAFAWLRPIQRGSIHFYLLYILATLVVLLIFS